MAPIFATWFDVASQHALAFGLGLVIGFILSNRYRIQRRNPDDHLP